MHGIWDSSETGWICEKCYAVGSNGTILHYDGSGVWFPLTSGTENDLLEVWGSSDNDIFAVGRDGIILHYDGSGDWIPMTSGTENTLHGVWGISGNDVFAVGYYGTILHYDGRDWSPMNSHTIYILFNIWGSAANDVFVAGAGGRILHYDGVGWSRMTITPGTSKWLHGIWGKAGATNDVFAVGTLGTILHYSYATTYFSIVATADTGGSISPSGEVTVKQGDNQTFTIRPRTYYSINRVTVDGVSVGPVSSHTFRNVVANHKIESTFERRQIIRCPNVVGTSLPQAKRMIGEAGFRLGRVTRTSLPWWMRFMWWLKDTVKYQRPNGGATVPFDTKVDLLVWT